MITRNQACYESPHLLMWMLRQDSTQRARRAALGGARWQTARNPIPIETASGGLNWSTTSAS